MKGVWRTHLRGSGLGAQYSGEAQPLVHDGVIYVVTGANDAFAVSVDSGEILWEYRANLDPANTSVCCGWTSRGLGLGDGKVFVGQPLVGAATRSEPANAGARRMVWASTPAASTTRGAISSNDEVFRPHL